MSLKQQALSYAKRGWKVLPLHFITNNGICSCQKGANCKSAGKHPMLQHGLKDASSDPADINKWWDRWEYSNIGIVTGDISGFWVLDIDPRNGGDDSFADLELEYGELPKTLTAHTGGGGRHFLFKMPRGSFNCGKLRDGIDIKSNGGYIVATPSNHISGGVYRWLNDHEIVQAPDWLHDIPKKVVSPVSFKHTKTPKDLEKLAEISEALNCMPSDDRDEWLYVGMALHSAIPQLGENASYNLWVQWSKKSTKFDATDQARVWESFNESAGITLSTLFALAKKYGYFDSKGLSQTEGNSKITNIKDVELLDLEDKGVVEMPDLLLSPTGILGEIVDYIDQTAIRPQRCMAVASAITMLGTILGRKYATESGLRTNIYMIAIGATGCGKNHARTAIKKILNVCDLSDRLGGEELASGQAILSRVAKTPSVLFQLDEFGMMMSAIVNPNAGSHLVSILSNLMKLFSSAGDTYIGTEYADQEKRPRIEIDCPCVSVYGTTTPETFYKALGSSHVVSGYLNRMLVVETAVNRPKRQKAFPRDVPDQIIKWAKRAVGSGESTSNLVGLNPKAPIVVPMSPSAEALFDSFDLEIDKAMDKDRGSGLDALHNRAWEHGAKLALIVALSRSLVRPTITAEDAEYAITFVKWSLAKLIHEVEVRVSDSPFQSKVKECLLTLIKAGDRGLTDREMGRLGSWAKMEVKERQKVLDALAVAGQASKVQIPTKGRSRIAWVATK